MCPSVAPGPSWRKVFGPEKEERAYQPSSDKQALRGSPPGCVASGVLSVN
jgi:hypothetical protein